MAAEVFHGNWKIIECVNISNARNAPPSRIEGAVFTLQENGEIRWECPPEVDATFPLFQCDCYEVIHSFVGVSIQMGALHGHMFEFWVDRPVPRDMMLLTFEGWCMIQCAQVIVPPTLDFPFSFLPALSDGYFSDVELSGVDGTLLNSKEFKVHSVILRVSGGTATELEGLPSDVLAPVLHFLYSQSLPAPFSTATAERCLQLAPPHMTQFTQLCSQYLHRASLKQKIVGLIEEIDALTEGVGRVFEEGWVTQAHKFCWVVRQSLQLGTVCVVKLVELCVLYGEQAPELIRNERLEILRFAKTKLSLFLKHFIAVLRVVKTDCAHLSAADRNDISSGVVPEIQLLLALLTGLMQEGKDACADIWLNWANHGEGGASEGGEESSLTETLLGIFRKREVAKLHSIQAQIASLFAYLTQKKENFEEMSLPIKVKCVARNLEQLVEELPVFLLRLEEIMVAFDDRFQWKDFKFCLQLAISQVCQTIHHLREERERLYKFFSCLCDLVQRDDFHQSLVNLGLIDTQRHDDSGTAQSDGSLGKDGGASQSPGTLGARKGKRKEELKDNDWANQDPNLFENVCTPKKSRENVLAKNAATLYETKEFADMVFEIPKDGEREMVEIPAHRVLVAARCDWFRRALLSGMKESIHKRIVIHDCSSSVFDLFLRFIYSGQLPEAEPKTMDTFTDLLSLADRYEMDALKTTCEQQLVYKHLDENSVIFLLSLADQFNARTLRGACMEYIAGNPDIMARELFEELSPELQMEVYDITMWSKPNRKVFSTSDELFNCPRYMLVPESSTSSSSSSSSPCAEDEEESAQPIVRRSHHHHHHHHTHSHRHRHHHKVEEGGACSEDGLSAESTAEMERCVRELRDVLGEEVPLEQLKMIAVTADFDVNRALNFFFRLE